MWSGLIKSLQADLYRIDGRQGLKAFVKTFFTSPGFRYVVLMRTCKLTRRNPLLKLTIYPVLLFWFIQVGRSYGIRLPMDCEVGDGLLIEHWGGIWINPSCKIGSNCNIAHGVTLGWVGHGTHRGAPIIGNNVFLGPGSVILGRVTVGNHALVSANSTVLQDIPEEAVVIGVPGRVFSRTGSHEIIKYPAKVE